MNPLDRFYVEGYYDSSVELHCNDCPNFTGSIRYASVPEIIQIAHEHLKQWHKD